MSVGDTTIFNATAFYLATGEAKLGKVAGWRAAFSTATWAALSAGLSNPRFGTAPLEEVTAGGHYASGGLVLTTIADTVASATSVGTVRLALDTSAHPEGRLFMSATTGNPAIVRTIIVYDSSASGNEAVIAIDLTSDGVTPVNFTSRELRLYVGSSSTTGVFFTQSVV